MRKNDVEELLQEVEETLTLAEKNNKCSKPRTKSILEHLRSSLEYMAHDINDLLSKPRQRIYFPYGNTEDDFDKSVMKNFPLIKTEFPLVYDLIADLQPHKSKDNWLIMMCELTNEAKHRNPIRTTSNKRHALNVSMPGIKITGFDAPALTIKGVTRNGQSVDDIEFLDGEFRVTRKGDIVVDFQITEKNEILIAGSTYPLFYFLKKCLTNTRDFSQQLYNLLAVPSIS